MQKNIARILFVLLTGGCCLLHGQSQQVEEDTIKNLRLNVLPVVFYTPETGLGYGALGLSTFRLKGEKTTTRPSSVQLGITFTSKKQFLMFMPYEFYLDEERWRFKGELGYYKYFYNYYGLGMDSREEDKELYTADFPRFRLAAYRELFKGFSVGLGYEFDGYNVLEPEPNGLLDATADIIGKDGGTISNIGLLALYDTRDNIFHPTKGWYIEGVFYNSAPWLGSDFTYRKFELDTRYYQRIKGDIILASNLFFGNRSSGTPFQDLNYLGTKRTRGFDNRRYLDKNEISLATELRFPIYRRFKGAVFGASGTVIPSLSQAINTSYKSAFGGGFRYIVNKKEGTRLRVDYGISSEGGQFYFTINEAF
ncbi:BamA/TamA family outer membrane protein [Maribacter sp. MAR_2009_72]|uniref:BamA/TamA family outer membrane protein n=1 Tax=Maribacter sp. MAR_2009_72 TaxID=1250050 RepID=UPI00119C62CC|nr:BamA/TamA family outer membrane protein [Maribacter sp. MAR_2009_72]TVZ14621.1 surface antigen-like protein [Maribacter sp. MAR_2009_72]